MSREITGFRFIINENIPPNEIHRLKGVEITDDFRLIIHTEPLITNIAENSQETNLKSNPATGRNR